jgi:hypothetical protein
VFIKALTSSLHTEKKEKKKDMRFSSKTFAAIALLLISSFAISLVAVPAALAHDPPWEFHTVAHVVPTVNPVGVGQKLYIYMWIDKIKPSAALENDIRMHDYKLTITDSDDNVVLEETFDTVQDTTSNQIYGWTPDTAGTYTITFEFPGDTYTAQDAAQGSSSYENDIYLESSATATLVVQDEPISGYPASYPLPSEYWTRPIYGENPDWWMISSNWLGSGAADYGGYGVSFNMGGNGNKWGPTDNVGPQTAHVMWAIPYNDGGVVGGDLFDDYKGNTWFEGSAYNQRFTNPIIVNGRLYYTNTYSFVVSFFGASGPMKCVDLHTGELIWSRDDVPALSFAYIYDVEDPNQHGVFPAILFTSNFGSAYDAETGNHLFDVRNVPSDSSGFARNKGPKGEQIRYAFVNEGSRNNPDYYLGEWNSSNLWSYTGLSPSIRTQNHDTTRNVTTTSWINGSLTTTTVEETTRETYVDASGSYMYDWYEPVSWRNTITGGVTVIGTIFDDVMLCMNGSLPSSGSPFMGTYGYNDYDYFLVNLNPDQGTPGDILWRQTYHPAPNNVTVLNVGVDPVNRVFVQNWRETIQFVGYDLDSGDEIWGPTDPLDALDYYGSQSSGSIATAFAYGRLYTSAYAGVLHCFDTTDGEKLFTYGNGGEGNSTNSGFQVPGPYPTFINAIGNDVVYLVTSEHTIETPLYKGARTRAVNATTGEEIWTLNSYVGEFFASSFAMADGYAVWFNGLDNRIYSVGRGPSATTVTAPTLGAAFGQPVVITGTVMDVAAGTKQTEQAGRFPNGVPCVSDENMYDWMGYVWQQKPFPSDCTGVPVTIDVMDSNGNYRTIGTAESDASGVFSLTWVPDIPGNFTVVASFEGTNGYWPSFAETAFTVMEPPEATPPPTPPPAGMTDTYVAGFGIALLIILVAGIVIIVLMLRRR